MTTPAAAGTPTELGLVRWGRSLESAAAASRRSGKPVLVLFQEVPGCQTCVSFGAGPLSHPLLVEAIETEFEPVLVYNNRPGADADLLARFTEPSCNFPVMRFQDADGRDLLPRREGVWDAGGIAARLVQALEAARRPVPGYLALARDEAAPATASATFTMGCFWEGEAALGGVDGVVSTRAAYVDGEEAVELRYDPARVSYAELVKRANGMSCARHVVARTDDQLREARAVVGARAARSDEAARPAAATDQKHDLQASPLRLVPLTPLQATRVNAALAAGEDPARWLSPRQQELARAVSAALARDGRAFAGLERPASIAALPEYERALRARLERAAKPRG